MDEWNERVERKIEFLVEAQARMTAAVEKLAEDSAILTRVMARLSERTKTTEDRLDAVVTVIERLAHELEELREIHKRNEEASEKRFKALDERLNILMNVTERHIAGPGHQHNA